MRIRRSHFASLLILTSILAISSGCGYSKPASGVAPQLTTLVPANTAAGSPAFTLTVNGSGFASGSIVYWNTTLRTTAYVSATQLTAQITVADVMTATTAMVYVHTAGGGYGGGTNSNSVSFAVN